MGTCYSHLSPDERIRIERLHCEQGLSVRETARLVGRDRATVSRELKRGLWFASNENESYRPYRPRRLKTGPWTSMPVFRQIGVNSVGTYSGHCRRSCWTVWAVGWFPLFVGYFMSEWVFR